MREQIADKLNRLMIDAAQKYNLNGKMLYDKYFNGEILSVYDIYETIPELWPYDMIYGEITRHGNTYQTPITFTNVKNDHDQFTVVEHVTVKRGKLTALVFK